VAIDVDTIYWACVVSACPSAETFFFSSFTVGFSLVITQWGSGSDSDEHFWYCMANLQLIAQIFGIVGISITVTTAWRVSVYPLLITLSQFALLIRDRLLYYPLTPWMRDWSAWAVAIEWGFPWSFVLCVNDTFDCYVLAVVWEMGVNLLKLVCPRMRGVKSDTKMVIDFFQHR